MTACSVEQDAEGGAVVLSRARRAPGAAISNAALIGGRTNPQPGEVSLAHHGVLFLDELTGCPARCVLEGLRQPLEDRTVTVTQAPATLTFPSAFQMVAAANTCPCGYLGEAIGGSAPCTPAAVERYLDRGFRGRCSTGSISR